MSSRSGFHCVQSIDLVQAAPILAPCHPPGSDLLDVHDLLVLRRSTAAQHPNPPLTVVALERPDSGVKSEALPFVVGWTLTLQGVIRARNPSAVVILRMGGSNMNENDKNEGVRILGCEGDVAPQSRAECTVSLKIQMSVKLTGWRWESQSSRQICSHDAAGSGNRRANRGSGSQSKRGEFGCCHTGIRKSSVE